MKRQSALGSAEGFSTHFYRWIGHRAPLSICASIAVTLAMALAAPAAWAHFAAFPIGADSVSIQTQGDPSTWTFSYATSGQQVLIIAHDPTVDSTSLLVRGTGASAGRTSLIRLPVANWAADPGTGGYQYTDLAGTDGGVTSVALASGSLSIQASGANWPWEIAGAQDSVWVEFWIGEELFCSEFTPSSASIAANAAGHFAATSASAPLACQEPVCGNGIHELGEECDDGNFDNGDGCTDQCVTAPCTAIAYPSTWEAIQSVVIGQTAFEGYSCLFCHDALNPLPPLFVPNAPDLRPGVAYANMLNVPSANALNQDDLIEPGEPIASFLYQKLAAATNGTSLPLGEGFGMPSGAVPPLTADHLEAVRLWIRSGAPETGVVEGTADLLSACLPPPTPSKIPQPDPPPAGTGVQLLQTPWDLPAQSEDEICMTTYYDFTATTLVPEEFQTDCPGLFGPNNPSNKCFLYHGQTLVQDAQSHHSILHIYQGAFDVNYDDAAGSGLQQFGPFTYKKGPNAGQSCDPKAVDPATGVNNDCSGKVVSTLACLSAPVLGTVFGPPDYGNANDVAPAFGGSQEPYAENNFALGVYAVLPLQGVVVWNSHAFNLTNDDSTMEQYLNIRFAEPWNQMFPAQAIFDSVSIFSQNVPVYGTQEVCRTYTVEQNARVFHINSHTHRWGVRFRVWEPPNIPCFPDADGNGCSPGDPSQLIYFSTEYTDPVDLKFDPPVLYDSPNTNDRTFLYCSLYDNGSTVSSPTVKRQSTSPEAPGNLGPFVSGGPCDNSTVACLGGTNAGTLCNGNGAVCDSGICDACPVRGGVTTEDEMFILTGTYYVPEPSGLALLLSGAVGLLALGRRRSRAQGPRSAA